MKQFRKLLAAIVLLVTAFVMVASVSYAWMTMSNNPVMQGIQITISGSHTVLVAPDISYVQNGTIVHYPGSFDDHILFSQHEQYRYLQNVGGLLPVSTADGLNWFIPQYYEKTDREVQRGQAYAGQIRPTSEFLNDNRLAYANMTADRIDEQADGSYVYLDFWVVAPVDGYKLRVSTGDEVNGGSFVIDLLEPEKTTVDGVTLYTLTKENQQAAACVRVGFLINEDTQLDDSMMYYSQSGHYDSRFKRLQGVYSEPGMSALESANNRFTIYEPNGDLHPIPVTDLLGNSIENGMYAVTDPLGLGGSAVSVKDKLSVQLTNRWTMLGDELYIQQKFASTFPVQNMGIDTANSLYKRFYVDTLQHQLYPYVNKGNFLSNTSLVYAAAGTNKTVDSMSLAQLPQSGATEDVYLTQLTGCVPQRVRMFIWLEGQDVDCVNAAATAGFSISIELAGSNAS